MKITFLGDIVLDHQINVDPKLSQILNCSDYVIANLEGVILKNLKGISPFKTYGSIVHNDYDSVMRIIETAGITHVNLYNNHMIDYGELFLEQTMSMLSNAGVSVLSQKNSLRLEGEGIQLNNSGLAETFGIYEVAKKFGQNVNDMLFEKFPENEWAESIIYSHFGIEMVNGLSDYELKWFDLISHYSPRIIVRHHPHCIQKPFYMNGVPCFPSIGDFAFNFRNKNFSKGLMVILDTANSDIQYYEIECKNYQIYLRTNQLKVMPGEMPVKLSEFEYDLLRRRYLME